jgi:hypothetical protein
MPNTSKMKPQEPAVPGGKEPIVYGKQVIDGIMVRPDTRSVMLKAVLEGQPIIVTCNNDYINLYHVFERLRENDPRVKALVKKRNLRIIRKQTDVARWLIYVVSGDQEKPGAELASGYDPKRGRYKRYAEQLAEGNVLQLPDKPTAIKARRAWHLYVAAGQRKHLRSTVRQVPKTGKWLVGIVPRAG